MLILKPSVRKILFLCFVFILLASLCFFIEVISNKITYGTHIIRIYEFIFCILLAGYYLIQLIPGYAQFIIDEKGFSEIWFFRQRINISWLSIDLQKCKQAGAGDTLYINSINEQLFTSKKVCKGTYSLSEQGLYQTIIEQLERFSKITRTKGNRYLVFVKLKSTLLVVFSIIIIALNSYFLNTEKTDPAFIEQVRYWQQQGNTDEQLFELFKIYGFYWKNQLKQFDRKLFYRILLKESVQIEQLMFKRNQTMPGFDKEQFKQQLTDCKNKYLFYDETMYLQCLDKI